MVAVTQSRACVHGQDAPRRRLDNHQPEREVDPAGQAKRTLVSATPRRGRRSRAAATAATAAHHAQSRSTLAHDRRQGTRTQAAGTTQGGTVGCGATLGPRSAKLRPDRVTPLGVECGETGTGAGTGVVIGAFALCWSERANIVLHPGMCRPGQPNRGIVDEKGV